METTNFQRFTSQFLLLYNFWMKFLKFFFVRLLFINLFHLPKKQFLFDVIVSNLLRASSRKKIIWIISKSANSVIIETNCCLNKKREGDNEPLIRYTKPIFLNYLSVCFTILYMTRLRSLEPKFSRLKLDITEIGIRELYFFYKSKCNQKQSQSYQI